MIFKNRIFQNASWIIACKIIQAALGLVVTMISARYLGPSGYGLINYAASVMAFATPLMQLGLNSVLVQELVRSPEKEGEILGTALGMSFFMSFVCIGGVTAFAAFANAGETMTIVVCALYSLLLIFESLEVTQYWFQAHLLSKYTSLAMLGAYVVTSAYKIFLLMRGSHIYWFAVSQAVDYMLIAVALLIIYGRLGTQRLRFSFRTVGHLFNQSKHFIIPAMMITIFAQTDKIMLKLMVGAEATGLYAAAIGCATMTGFVFQAIIDSARPSIFESKEHDEAHYRRSLTRLFSVITYLSIAQCLVFTFGAPLIMDILYGEDYLSAVGVLQLGVWYTTFAYLGAVRNIWILAENKQKYLWIINLSGAALNVLLNWFLIPRYGMMGAAFASLVTQIFNNIIINWLILPIAGVNTLMFRSLNPAYLLDFLPRRKKGNTNDEKH